MSDFNRVNALSAMLAMSVLAMDPPIRYTGPYRGPGSSISKDERARRKRKVKLAKQSRKRNRK